jgi:transcriptional regulator GlxA family with amidase domain
MDKRIQIAIALMGEELSRETSNRQLAHAVGLSPSRFQHLFKSETGVTPICYLRQLRLERAKWLLETSLLRVKQVMTRVGIKDKSHFTREFKRAYGVTPTKLRAMHSPAGAGGGKVSTAVSANR